jgi:hypothetical protein
MTKIAAIIGGVLILAGAAIAGTVSSLGSSNGPQTQFSPAASTTTVGQDDRGRETENRGRENEARGRENEAGEDLRGPCDEAEHANDPRCTGAAAPRAEDDNDAAEDRHDAGDDRGGEDNSGHGGDGEDD